MRCHDCDFSKIAFRHDEKKKLVAAFVFKVIAGLRYGAAVAFSVSFRDTIGFPGFFLAAADIAF